MTRSSNTWMPALTRCTAAFLAFLFLSTGGSLASASSDPSDLAAITPGSRDICSAVQAIRANGRGQQMIALTLPVEQSPSTLNPRLDMTEEAWREATAPDSSIDSYSENRFSVARVALTASGPKTWVFATTIGSLHNPRSWIFSSTRDGAKAEHLLGHLGFEGSGPFNTYFVRYRKQPFAMIGDIGQGTFFLEVYTLDPATSLCTFRPPAQQFRDPWAQYLNSIK